MKPETISHLGRDNSRGYHENAYLGAHNAFANHPAGFVYAQQSLSLWDQLAYGATALLLDIWDYDGDVFLLHGYPKWGSFTNPPLRNFTSLTDGLAVIRAFMELHPDTVYTILFEDWVSHNRPKIRQAFLTSGLWENVFFAGQINKGWDWNTQGWPTLAWMISHGLNLVVFSSRSGPFPNQWTYLAENVYGNRSMEPATWVQARAESAPLSQRALCALNRFPDFDLGGVRFLPRGFSPAYRNNSAVLSAAHIDDCFEEWHRLPNFLNLDFVHLPYEEARAAIFGLNQRLHVV